MGALRGFKEALFSTLFLQIFFRIFQNFVPKMPEESPKVLEQPFARVPKIRHLLSLTSRQPQRPQNISKKFSIISGAPTWRIYKVHRQALPGPQNRKRVHGEFCSESCGGFPRCIFGGSYGASLQQDSSQPSSDPQKSAAQSNYPSRCT